MIERTYPHPGETYPLHGLRAYFAGFEAIAFNQHGKPIIVSNLEQVSIFALPSNQNVKIKALKNFIKSMPVLGDIMILASIEYDNGSIVYAHNRDNNLQLNEQRCIRRYFQKISFIL